MPKEKIKKIIKKRIKKLSLREKLKFMGSLSGVSFDTQNNRTCLNFIWIDENIQENFETKLANLYDFYEKNKYFSMINIWTTSRNEKYIDEHTNLRKVVNLRLVLSTDVDLWMRKILLTNHISFRYKADMLKMNILSYFYRYSMFDYVFVGDLDVKPFKLTELKTKLITELKEMYFTQENNSIKFIGIPTGGSTLKSFFNIFNKTVSTPEFFEYLMHKSYESDVDDSWLEIFVNSMLSMLKKRK